MKLTRQEVYGAIDTEREYQLQVWNDYKNNDKSRDNPLTVGENLVLIREYLRKAESAWCAENKPAINTLDIIRKIAGICVRTGEEHGMPTR